MMTKIDTHTRILGAIVFSLIGFLLMSTDVLAQAGGEGVDLRPAIIEDRADPGEVFRFSVKVTNISGSEKTFYLTAQDITGLDDAGLPIFSEETEVTPFELSSWVELPEESITIPANESRDVPFTIRVPKDASPGAHFGGVFLDVRPPRQRTTGVSVGFKVGTIINLRIAGEVVEEAQLREFSTERMIYGNPSIRFKSNVANTGNVLLRPHGLIEISDMRGVDVGTIQVNDSGSATFPGSEKVYVTDWEYEGFAFGRYQAVVSLVYGEDGRKTISGTTSFWVLPFKPILTVLGSIFFVVLMLFLFVRMYISRKLREMGGGRSDMIARRRQSPVSRLLVITLGLLFASIAFLVVLFLMFA